MNEKPKKKHLGLHIYLFIICVISGLFLNILIGQYFQSDCYEAMKKVVIDPSTDAACRDITKNFAYVIISDKLIINVLFPIINICLFVSGAFIIAYKENEKLKEKIKNILVVAGMILSSLIGSIIMYFI